MSRLFLRLVSMSIAAGWLVLAVLALRAALHRSPRRILCLLWVLVAVRLVCPLSIESRVSVVPRQETVVQSVQQILDAEPTDTSPTPTERTSVVSALSRVWLAGLSAMLLWALWGDLRLRRRVRVSLPQGERIRVCDEINTPFVLGLLRPRIYLPSRLDPAQAVYVIAHENAHIARLDHWWKPLGWLLLSVYWFHPLLWLAYVLFCRDLELACDERVAEQLDRGGLAAYSEALLHCSRVRRGDMVFPVAFGEVGVKTRVKAILRYHRPGRRLVAASLAAVLAVGVLFLTDRPVLAAQLQELLPAADEAAWTIPLDDYHRSPDVSPEPSATPEPSQSPPAGNAAPTVQTAPTSAYQDPQPIMESTPSAPPETSAPEPTLPPAPDTGGDIVDSGGF